MNEINLNKLYDLRQISIPADLFQMDHIPPTLQKQRKDKKPLPAITSDIFG